MIQRNALDWDFGLHLSCKPEVTRCSSQTLSIGWVWLGPGGADRDRENNLREKKDANKKQRRGNFVTDSV